jgi:hypothetical protein
VRPRFAICRDFNDFVFRAWWSQVIPLYIKVCGRGGTGIRTGLDQNLSARWETAEVELPKFVETFTGNPEPSPGGGRCRD